MDINFSLIWDALPLLLAGAGRDARGDFQAVHPV
mgnify:CR=1 FL=1